MPRPLVRDRSTALYLGFGAWVLGTLLLWDAYEHRGHSRPFGLKLTGAASGLLP